MKKQAKYKKIHATISQCMIVRNEEDNLPKALAWGKGIVSEQIVVDTGSTDNTIVIAEKLGAKVYRFPWCDDFSAAKNFAIEQASGSWIAFLDADEYFTEESSRYLPQLLNTIDNARVPVSQKPNIIASRMLHLDDAGNVTAENIQDRVFRNRKDIRYQNKIHESLVMQDGAGLIRLEAYTSLTIIHTGYSDSAYKKTDKLTRNIRMLKKELENQPDNISLLSYLGDCYVSMEMMETAEHIFKKIILMPSLGKKENIVRFHAAAKALEIVVTAENKCIDESNLKWLYDRAEELESTHPDPDYFMGIWNYKIKNYARILFYLEKSLDKAGKYKGLAPVVMTGKKLVSVYDILLETSLTLSDRERIVKYAVLSLGADRYQSDVMVVLIQVFTEMPGSSGEMEGFFNFLEKIYSLENLKDKLFLLKCAKISRNMLLEKQIKNTFTNEELQWLESE